MENLVYIGLSRQMALRQEMDTIAQNVANTNTPAFKAERLLFREFMKNVPGSSRFEVSMVQDYAQLRDTSEGALRPTGNPLDVALHGEGYFVVDTPLGERFTRNGHFRLNQDRQIVTSEGHVVQGDGGPLEIPAGDSRINIAKDGTLSTEGGVVGNLRVVRFDDEQALVKAAGSMFIAEVPPQDVERPAMSQKMLEGSNVKAVMEMTRMINVHRSHDSISRMLRGADEREQRMVRVLGRVPGQ